MSDSKIRTSSPMTFYHFRHDVRKKRKKIIAIVVVFSIGTFDKVLRHIILFLVGAHSAREKMLNIFRNIFPELYQWKIVSSKFIIDWSVDSGIWLYLSNNLKSAL